MYVHFTDGAGQDQAEPDSQLWDERLDAWLLDHGVRAKSAENEAERFGYSLHQRFSAPIEKVGDGYFNSVLADLLREEELGRLPAVAEKLQFVREYAPARGASRDDCRAMIEAALKSVGRDLTERLKYRDEEAAAILGGALAYYLDERFGLTNRRMLGWP